MSSLKASSKSGFAYSVIYFDRMTWQAEDRSSGSNINIDLADRTMLPSRLLIPPPSQVLFVAVGCNSQNVCPRVGVESCQSAEDHPEMIGHDSSSVPITQLQEHPVYPRALRLSGLRSGTTCRIGVAGLGYRKRCRRGPRCQPQKREVYHGLISVLVNVI